MKEILKEPTIQRGKYPECEKLQEAGNVHSRLMEFVEWLQKNNYDVPLKSVYLFMGVDEKKLEQERRQLIKLMTS